MNKKLLKQLQARHEKRLSELRSSIESGEVRDAELEAITEEIEGLVDELKEIKDELETVDEDNGTEEEPIDPEPTSEDNTRSDDPTENENRAGMINHEQRDGLLGAIKTGLEARGRMNKEQQSQQIRSAFANFVVGNISESEARSLGIEAGNGSVTVPVEISTEVITYAQEQNLLRKYGTYVSTDADVKYPVLVKKAEAQGHKKERTNDEVPETGIEFDSIDLDPTEFDALATISKKLLKRTGVKIEQIVIDELKKAYVRKEAQYMFNGDEAKNLNPGALAKKAVAYFESKDVVVGAEKWSQDLQDELTILTGVPVTEVVKNAMWIVNRSAYNILKRMTDVNGRKLLEKNENGILEYDGFPLDFTDDANKSATDTNTPVFYFGDISSFHIQEVDGGMELQKLVEKFSGTNKVGFQIYNLIDGQLIYSPFEPSVYRYEIGAKAPTGGK